MKQTFKFGKTPARPDAVKFKFSKYANKAKLPKPPKAFGHENVLPQKGWGMMANDKYGCCVLAAAAHETMLWTRLSNTAPDANFTDANVLAAYSAITGFDPNKPNTDQGTDMKDAASYRRKTGITDAAGVVHKIDAYLSIDATNLTEHFQAAYLFGLIEIGIQCPSNIIDEFNAGKPWSVPKGRVTIEGGHDIPMIFHRGNIGVVTWGATQQMTTGFFGKYNDESIAHLSAEMFDNRKSPEGFDYDALLADLSALK